MKKILSLIMVLAIILSLTACGNQRKAFEASKAAYTDIDKAYEITEQFGSDIYEAWRLGLYEADEVKSKGVSYLAEELSLTEEELTDGLTYWMATVFFNEDWDALDESEKNDRREKSDIMFAAFDDDLFFLCVEIVSNAYLLNGKAAEAQAALDAAKEKMKGLSETYSDYEHYPNLKGYYTTTSSFFDFCQNLTGTFEQMKDTMYDYKNEARDCRSDLDYIFEE